MPISPPLQFFHACRTYPLAYAHSRSPPVTPIRACTHSKNLATTASAASQNHHLILLLTHLNPPSPSPPRHLPALHATASDPSLACVHRHGLTHGHLPEPGEPHGPTDVPSPNTPLRRLTSVPPSVNACGSSSSAFARSMTLLTVASAALGAKLHRAKALSGCRALAIVGRSPLQHL